MSADLPPNLAAIQYERDFDINGILRKVVKSLQEKGVMVSGVLQEAEFRPNGCCARLNIVDIRTGKTERITQDRGRESRGCKLDPRGLAAISHCITDAIDADVDLVIINKFGSRAGEGCIRTGGDGIGDYEQMSTVSRYEFSPVYADILRWSQVR